MLQLFMKTVFATYKYQNRRKAVKLNIQFYCFFSIICKLQNAIIETSEIDNGYQTNGEKELIRNIGLFARR